MNLNLSEDLAAFSGLSVPNSGFNVSQLFSYYPKYDYLDKLVSLNPKKHFNFFIDLKGCSPSMYQEWAVKYVIDRSRNSPHISMDYFASVIEFIAWHKLYCQKRDLTMNMYFFMEQGKSVYHNTIYKDYKNNRDLSDFFGLDLADRDYYFSVMDKNYDLLEYTLNKIPNINFYRLKYCEADFIPWYLLEYLIPKVEQEESLNVVYTRDKDHLQCLKFPNTYQYYRANYREVTRLITQKSLLRSWAKLEENLECDRVAEWFPLLLAMLGDDSDGIPGIKGIGKKVIIKNLEAIKNVYGGNPDTMYDTIMNGKDVLSESFTKVAKVGETTRKLFGNHDILKRNMKLISFRAISEWLNSGYPLDTVEKKKYIESVYGNTNKLSNYKVIIDALNAKGMGDVLNEQSLERCFMK